MQQKVVILIIVNKNFHFSSTTVFLFVN